MPTKSLYQDLVIDTPEALENYRKAFEIAKERGPIDTSEALEIIRDHAKIRKIIGLDD